MKFDPTELLSQLSTLEREDGDIKLKCEGVEVKAHSFVLSLRSKYFATALTTDVGSVKSKSEMEVKDCSPEVLTCAVDFMYGNPIPEDFADTHGLLHQADLFMMKDLKTAAGLLISKTLSLDTIKELFLLGEKYKEVKLQESCGEFIATNIGELDDDLLAELDMPLTARVAFQAMKKKSRSHLMETVLGISIYPDDFKRRSDFPDEDAKAYKAYVKGHIRANMLVRCCETFLYHRVGANMAYTAKVGDIGRIINPQLSGVQVKWKNGSTSQPTDCFEKLELLTVPVNTTIFT